MVRLFFNSKAKTLVAAQFFSNNGIKYPVNSTRQTVGEYKRVGEKPPFIKKISQKREKL